MRAMLSFFAFSTLVMHRLFRYCIVPSQSIASYTRIASLHNGDCLGLLISLRSVESLELWIYMLKNVTMRLQRRVTSCDRVMVIVLSRFGIMVFAS